MGGLCNRSLGVRVEKGHFFGTDQMGWAGFERLTCFFYIINGLSIITIVSISLNKIKLGAGMHHR